MVSAAPLGREFVCDEKKKKKKLLYPGTQINYHPTSGCFHVGPWTSQHVRMPFTSIVSSKHGPPYLFISQPLLLSLIRFQAGPVQSKQYKQYKNSHQSVVQLREQLFEKRKKINARGLMKQISKEKSKD